MIKIAVLGSTSYIAKDYISNIAKNSDYDAVLFSRDSDGVSRWLAQSGMPNRFSSYNYASFAGGTYDVVVNFVGVGDAVRMAKMGADILSVTDHYDSLSLDYIKRHPHCRYIFISSGGIYGGTFPHPADEHSHAVLSVNHVVPQEYYLLSKIYAEYKHRSMKDLAITDLKIFNYFSRTQNIENNYFMCVLLRAIRDDIVLQVTNEPMVRDYLHPEDFCRLLDCILKSAPANAPIDCYSKAPIDKESLLDEMEKTFGLRYRINNSFKDGIRDFTKNFYYSKNRGAALYGYQPGYSSQDCLIVESTVILKENRESKYGRPNK